MNLLAILYPSKEIIMHAKRRILLIALLLMGLLQTTFPVAHVQAQATIAVVDPSVIYVRNWEGWGTSLAWWATIVGGWSDTNRNALADTFFGTNGLRINVVRYNIGGSAIDQPGMNPGKLVESYINADGSYDWTRDANQRWMLSAAIARGANILEAWSDSPPWFMTTNGDVRGADDCGNNLRGFWGYDGDGTGAYNGTTSYSNTTDDWVTLSFSGTQIQFYGSKASDSGKGAISIDGGGETVIDFYTATRTGNVLMYTSPTLANGTHTFKLRVTGTKHASSSNYYISPDRVVINGSTSVDDQVRGTGLNQFNYHWDQYDAFADYLTEVTRHFRDNWSITFRTLNALNEPNATWWCPTNQNLQEGCHFDRPRQDHILAKVGDSLVAKGLIGTKLSGPDETAPGEATLSVNSYGSVTNGYLTQINSHTYQGDDYDRMNLHNRALSLDKRLWMSERDGSPEGVPHDHNAIEPGTWLAETITRDVNFIKPASWVFWQVVEDEEIVTRPPAGSNWGLFHADYSGATEDYWITKKYYAYGNYTKFIRPGYQIIAPGYGKSLAAYSPSASKLVIVTYNDATADVSLTYDLTKFGTVTGPATPHRTSASENLVQLANLSVTNRQFTATAMANSITTYVISGVSSPAAPPAFPAPNTYYRLVNRNSGKLASVLGSSLANGADIVQWTSVGGTNQEWVFKYVGNGYYEIVNRNSGLPAEVYQESTADGANVDQWATNGGAHLQWSVTSLGGGYYKITNRNSGKVLDVANCGTADGADIRQWTWLNNNCQQWQIIPVYPTLVARHSGKCLDVPGWSTTVGTQLDQWGCNGGANQQWQLKPVGSYYQVVNVHSAQCADVTNASTLDGAAVIQYTCGSGTNQQWNLSYLGNGYYQVIARHSNKCLNVNGASTLDGALIIQWPCVGATNEEWSISYN
jgi:O-glycosyl hydrolase